MSLIKKNGVRRWSPSYVRNRGHMSKSQKQVFRSLWPKYGISLAYNEVLNITSLSPHASKVIVEIGFGQGEHLLSRAALEQTHFFVGLEVHKPAIATVLSQIQTTNIRLIRMDAIAFLSDFVVPNSIDELCIFFPEPWDNHHNQHRRILRSQTIPLFVAALKEKGILHFATDVVGYARQVQDLFTTDPRWSNLFPGFAPRPSWRPMSKYEQKGLDEGRCIYQLSYILHTKNPTLDCPP